MCRTIELYTSLGILFSYMELGVHSELSHPMRKPLCYYSYLQLKYSSLHCSLYYSHNKSGLDSDNQVRNYKEHYDRLILYSQQKSSNDNSSSECWMEGSWNRIQSRMSDWDTIVHTQELESWKNNKEVSLSCKLFSCGWTYGNLLHICHDPSICASFTDKSC